MTAQPTPPRRPFGPTGILVPPLCLGCAPLGDMPRVFNYSVPLERALATLRTALTGPLNYLDTSNGYGGGESERRVGLALREFGGVPAGAIVQTKVDRDPQTGSFSAARMRRSVEESLERLGLDRLGIVFLHDPENGSFDEITGPGGAVETLQAMQREDLIAHLGVAGGPIDLLIRYVETGAFTSVLTHNRYTLLDQSAEPLIALASARGLAVLNAAPYGGGLLVKGPDQFPRYMYRDAPQALLDRTRQFAALAEEYGVPLPALALQFSTRDPRIVTTVVGITHPERIAQTLDLYQTPIPDELWARFAALTR
jgi:D-threo-aldose 1-dehydrogenase